MSHPNGHISSHQSGKIRLLADKKALKTVTALTHTEQSWSARQYLKTISALLIHDVFVITVVLNFLSLGLPSITALLPISLSLFVILAHFLKLYNLQENHNIIGKLLIFSLLFWGTNSIFLGALAGHDQSWSLIFILMSAASLVMTVDHYLLSQPFAVPTNHGTYYLIEKGLKRLLDISIAAAVLLLCSPIMLLSVLLIALDGKGRIIIAQPRIGLNEKQFPMFKFRSMKVNADQMKVSLLPSQKTNTPTLFKMKNDPRITRFGYILRKMSIDELPQLFNVLRGEMSLVGPRPPLPNEYEQMNQWHRRKFRQLPGMTGLWQIHGRVRNERSFDAVAYYDNCYIDHWSLMNDIIIVLKTIPVVLLQKGAS